MKIDRHFPRAMLALLCLALCTAYGAESKSDIPILIVTGIDHPAHDWKTSTPALQEILSKDPRMKVEVLEDPYALEKTDLGKYRVVLLHFNNWEKPDPSEQAKMNLQNFVTNGGGLFVLHFACGAFPKWPEFATLAGRIWDGTNTHDPRGPFTVDIVNTNHAVTRGLSKFDTDDELYFCLTGKKPVELLATAKSKVTGRNEPMAMTHTYGKGRVFQTPLGHDAKAIRMSGEAELIRRGCAWAAGAEPKPVASVTLPPETQFQLPPGFRIELVASEPNIANPMTLCVDDDGSLFVTEAHTYRWGPEKSPYQPPSNPIKRIEFDQQGKVARVITSSEGYPNPVMGISAHAGKLYITSLNELFSMDILPDGKLANKKVLVTDASSPWNPFGMYRVVVGPNNHLWLAIADHPSTQPVELTGSDGQKIRFRGQSGGMARCRLDGSGLELIVHGFRAPYAFDFDPWGHIWHISNGEGSPNIYVHVIPGVDYGYASRQESFNWMAGGELFSPPVRDMGAGANTAARHYYSSMFPAEFWGNIFVANWGSHGKVPTNREITRYRREQNGAADAKLVPAGVFLSSSDPKFRPTDLVLAHDGSLYLSDWNGDDDENDTDGRIYRISYIKEQRAFQVTGSASSAELVEHLNHANHKIRQIARDELIKRADFAELQTLLANGPPLSAAEIIWGTWRLDPPAAWLLLSAGLKNPDGRVRAHALRTMRQVSGQTLSGIKLHTSIPPATVAAVTKPLLDDPDAEVRVEASLAQGTAGEIAKGLLSALTLPVDERLRYQIAFQLARNADPALIVALCDAPDSNRRFVGTLVLDIARHENPSLLENALRLNSKLLDAMPPARPDERYSWLAKNDPTAFAAEFAAIEAGQTKLNSPAAKLAALRSLQSWPGKLPKAPETWLHSILRDPDSLLQEEAIRTARHLALDSPPIVETVHAIFKNASSEVLRVEAVFFLAGVGAALTPLELSALLGSDKPIYATAFLRGLRETISSTATAEQIQAIAQQLTNHFPQLREELQATLMPASNEVAQPLFSPELYNHLISSVPAASPTLGRLVFESRRSACSTCHSTKPGEQRFGPSLAGIASSTQPEYLLESIGEPNKVIKTGFQSESVETNDGEVYEGLVEARGSSLLVRSSAAVSTDIPLAKVKSRLARTTSPMPAGLATQMTQSEAADLLSYLLTLKQ